MSVPGAELGELRNGATSHLLSANTPMIAAEDLCVTERHWHRDEV